MTCTDPNCAGMPPLPDPGVHRMLRGHPITGRPAPRVPVHVIPPQNADERRARDIALTYTMHLTHGSTPDDALAATGRTYRIRQPRLGQLLALGARWVE